MSIVTVLCFTSLLYFSLADPVPAAKWPQITEAQINAMVYDIQNVVDSHLAPLTEKLDQAYRDFLKEITYEAIFECVNSVESLIKQREQKINEWSKEFLNTEEFEAEK